MTRFGVMKHLRILEAAGLVVSRKVGREKLHYLNAVPVQLIHDRWVSKYTRPSAAALAGLKQALERTTVSMVPAVPKQVYQIFIRATPEQIWDAITMPEFTRTVFLWLARRNQRQRWHADQALCAGWHDPMGR